MNRPRTFHRQVRLSSPATAAVLTLAIFIVDTITPLEIAMGVFYVAVVLITMRFLAPRGVVLVAAGCIGLTVLSLLLTPRGSWEAGLVNAVISIIAIAATTYLARRLVAAEAAAHEARAHLSRMVRVTTLGELTASIAHEVNQPLAAVVASGAAAQRWLAMAPPNLPRARRALDRIIDDANRASAVIGRVRDLAKSAPPKTEKLDLNQVAGEVLSLVSGELRRNDISLSVRLAEDLPRAPIDAVQLQQVILNLVMNAVEALSAVNGRPRELLVSTRLGDDGVHLMVSDTGGGFPAGMAEQIFEPFYTSREGGMGIGLAISRSIIEAHGGAIVARSNAPTGTTVEFTVPIEKADVA